MGALIPISLFGWIPVVLILFSILPARRAVIAAYLFAWLFLPVAGYDLPGFTNYNKITATTVGVLLGILIFDNRKLKELRPTWLDLPMLAFCVSPFLSSISNGLGWYDGLSGASFKVLTWGLPYLTGRLYFSSLRGMQDLATAIVIGGLIYVPLCLWEVRMSPQLHANIYGFMQHAFDQSRRGGGFRPMVFMHHGLMLSMWMATATLLSTHMWLSRARHELYGMPMWMVSGVLFATTVLCKSSGATLLMLMGIGALLVMQRMKTALPILCLIGVPALYMGVRTNDTWSGEEALTAASWISADRAGSLKFRLDAEDRLAEHAMKRPIFGWGAWGRNFVTRSDESSQMVVADGLWILTLGTQGLFGLIALFGAALIPIYAFVLRYPPRHWHRPAFACAGVMAVALSLYMIDNLVNAMVNPIFMLMSGALAGVAIARKPFVRTRKSRRVEVTLPVQAAGAS